MVPDATARAAAVVLSRVAVATVEVVNIHSAVEETVSAWCSAAVVLEAVLEVAMVVELTSVRRVAGLPSCGRS